MDPLAKNFQSYVHKMCIRSVAGLAQPVILTDQLSKLWVDVVQDSQFGCQDLAIEILYVVTVKSYPEFFCCNNAMAAKTYTCL